MEYSLHVNKETLRKHYQKLADENIERLANYDAGDLSPEALAILKEEIKRPSLSGDLNTAADIQVRGISEGEQQELIRKISAFPCPICGTKQNYLNGFNLMRVRSYIIITTIERTITIACPEYISKSAKSTLVKNLFMDKLKTEFKGVDLNDFQFFRTLL